MIYKDQLDRSIRLADVPQRLVSLVPSLTELVCDLGQAHKLVGVTKFCVHPEFIKKKAQIIGGTKKIHLNRIKDLRPDFIIANKEENERSLIEPLGNSFPTYITDIKSSSDTLSFIHDLGQILNIQDRSTQLSKEVQEVFQKFSSRVAEPPRVIYLIWRDPFMAAGGDTYISCMLEHLGFHNCFSNKKRYPEITLEDIKAAKADYVFLSSEPYPFKETHLKEIESLSKNKCVLVDGEFFSWYGSRILHLKDYPAQLTSQL